MWPTPPMDSAQHGLARFSAALSGRGALKQISQGLPWVCCFLRCALWGRQNLSNANERFFARGMILAPPTTGRVATKQQTPGLPWEWAARRGCASLYSDPRPERGSSLVVSKSRSVA